MQEKVPEPRMASTVSDIKKPMYVSAKYRTRPSQAVLKALTTSAVRRPHLSDTNPVSGSASSVPNVRAEPINVRCHSSHAKSY